LISGVSPRAQHSTIADDVGLPPRPIEGLPLPPTDVFQNDVARILEEVKLPTRKEFHASGDTMMPTLEPEPEPQAPEPVPEPKPRDIVSAVHTLRDDFQSAVQDQKISVVQAAALQEQKRAHQMQTYNVSDGRAAQHPQRLKNFAIILILTCIGVAALGLILLFAENKRVETSTLLVEGLLFSEQATPLPLNNAAPSELRRQVATARATSDLTLGSITRVAPVIETQNDRGETTAKEASTREFLVAIGANVPEELLRALGNEFFFGFHAVDENAPILVVPVTSYERAFAGALAWEKTMNADLSPIFTAVPPLMQRNDGLIVERTFEDLVMRNYDVRALKDDAGTIQLYYSFPTRNILIIAESPYSFAEILARLRADRRL